MLWSSFTIQKSSVTFLIISLCKYAKVFYTFSKATDYISVLSGSHTCK